MKSDVKQNSPASACQLSTRSRYPGTQPFTESLEDQVRFFGRDREGEQLYLRVLSVPLLLQFAKSGLGKTSPFKRRCFRDYGRPFQAGMVRASMRKESLVDAVARSFNEAAAKHQFLKFKKDGLGIAFNSVGVARRSAVDPRVVFDQFEEVFTLRDMSFRDELAHEVAALYRRAPERLQSKQFGAPGAIRATRHQDRISLREDVFGASTNLVMPFQTFFDERLRL